METAASKNLEDIHPYVRAGWAAQIEQAKTKLSGLKREYQEALIKGAVAIFLEGDAEKVREVARQVTDGGGIALDAHALYERIADAIEPSISEARTWGVQQVYLLHTALMEVMKELDVTEMQMPDRSLEKVVPDRVATVAHIQQIVRDVGGDHLNRLYVERQVAVRAEAVAFSGSTAPVFLYAANSDEVAFLSNDFGKGSGTIAVDAKDEVNKEYLTQLMKEANKKIRKK